MTHILLENVCLHYPIRTNSNSIRKELIKSAFGQNIKKNYIEALSGINIEMTKGIYGLYGPNGSGKTTLLKIFAKIFEPTSGKVTINGSISSLINIHFGFNEELTGLENVISKLIIQKISKNIINDLAIKIINESGLESYSNLLLKTFSSGMKFRLAFFISKYFESEILLMDEWVGTADKTLTKVVDEVIAQKISKSQITVIASHNLERLQKTCSKIFFLEHGKIVQNN